MEVTLRSGKTDWKSVGQRALFDAIIWTWFHQMAYESLFTNQMAGAYDPKLYGMFGLVAGVGILIARWDVTPKGVRIAAPVTACVSTATLLLVSEFGLLGTAFELIARALFAISLFACQILRLENLTKCRNVKTLTLAMFGSFILFYLLCLVLTLVPSAVYNALVIVAPLVLLIDIGNPLKPTENARSLSRNMLFKVPNALVILFGIAGGFVFTSGAIFTATSPTNLLSSTLPTYLIMLLSFMALSVIVASGLRFRKAAYYSLTNMSWSVGQILGLLALNIAPVVPDTLSVTISAAVIITFFLFQSMWVGAPELDGASRNQATIKVAEEQGLTKRETEVVVLLLEGRNLRHIQSALFISEGTARTHVKRIYAKLGVHSKQELIDFFQSH